MRSWKFWIGLVVSVACLVLAVRGLDWEHFTAALREANYWWLIPGVLVYFGAVLARTWRWQVMLAHIRPVPLRRLFPVVVIGYMGNNIYPARAGEVLRSWVLKRQEGISMAASLTTVVLERLFDGLVMLLFVVVTLPFVQLPAIFSTLLVVLTALFLVALATFLTLAARPRRAQQVYTWFVERVVPARFRPQVHALFDPFIVGLQSLTSPRELLMLFATTVVIWLTETTKYWFVMHAFPFEVNFFVLMLMTAVVNLATTVPSTPGYVGTFDVPGILVLRQAGVPQAIATSYTLVLHIALWLPITLLGALFMARASIDWRMAGRSMQRRADDAPQIAPVLVAEEPEPEVVR